MQKNETIMSIEKEIQEMKENGTERFGEKVKDVHVKVL